MGILHMKDLGPLRRLRYKVQPDFINPDPVDLSFIGLMPKDVLEYIEKYQKTREPRYSYRVMYLLDKLIIRMLIQERRKYKTLQRMELQEMYQASFICLHHAMLKFDPKPEPARKSFPRFLQGYLKRELKRMIREKDKLVCCGGSVDSYDDKDPEDEETSMVVGVENAVYSTDNVKANLLFRVELESLMKDLVEKGVVSEDNMRLLKLKHMQGYTYKEIAAKENLGYYVVKERIKRVLNRLKKETKYFRQLSKKYG